MRHSGILQNAFQITGMALLIMALAAGCRGQPAPVSTEPVVDAAQAVAQEPPAPESTTEPAIQPTAAPTVEPSFTPTVEIQFTPTSEPTATSQPAFAMVRFDVPPVVFSPKTASSTLPDDVLREAGISMGQGGGDELNCASMPKTGQKFNVYGDASGQWLDGFILMACGWQPGEAVALTITGPDGSSVNETKLLMLDGGGALYRGLIEINTPPGTYRYQFSGASGSASLDAEVKLPDGPRVYQGKNRTLILYGFQPGERVRLFAYEGLEASEYVAANFDAVTLEAWQAFTVSEDGELVIQVDPAYDPYTITVVGDLSGDVRFYPARASSMRQTSSTKGLRAMLPTMEEYLKAKNIWELVKFEDLMKPGARTYALTVKPDDTFRWGFTWCADDPKKRDFPFARFSVNCEELDSAVVATVDKKASNGWSCTQRVTVIDNFKPGATYRLSVFYELKKSFFDGSATYPAGEYEQILEVTIE